MRVERVDAIGPSPCVEITDENWCALTDGRLMKSMTAADRWSYELAADHRFNEGACDPAGRLYVGSTAIEAGDELGSLIRIDPAGRPTTVLSEVSISNGLDWSPDQRVAYFVDSASGAIDAFDVDGQGEWQRRRVFAVVDPTVGAPDGLTVDGEGGVWVAIFGGGKVVRFDPTGHESVVVELPCPDVTACTFGGAGLDTLFVTTSRVRTSGVERDGAGAVFSVNPGVRGLPIHCFDG